MKTKSEPIEIPMEQLSEAAIKGLIDSFILREGTDYGAHEVSHQSKFQQVFTQLKKNYIKIMFDPETESITLIKAR